MIDRVRRLSNIQVAVILAFVGGATFFSGLSSPFIGDDDAQIVSNPLVHSLSNIGTFFHGGTFYFGHVPLSGPYFRPMVSIVYTLVYTTFGDNPTPFHVLQMVLCIVDAFLVYYFFKHSFTTAIAFVLALIFLIHPINSQVAFSIPYLQDPLFVFFGMLALCLLLRFKSVAVLFPVAALLMLSLLCKETGILFVGTILIYLIWWDRRRSYQFLTIMAIPLLVYLTLKIGATGLNTNPANAPIDSVDLGGRILTIPSIVLFYIAKVVWPEPLASAYYWTHPDFSFTWFVLPLIVDLAVCALIKYVGTLVRKHGTTAQHRTFWFFGAWAALGILAHLQIIPLDETVSETYAYFPLIGILGMVGIACASILPTVRLDRRVMALVSVALIVLLGVGTALRGTDWSSSYGLAQKDLAASPDDWRAEIVVAYHLGSDGDLEQAQSNAVHAVAIYPTGETYNVLGEVLLAQGQWTQARSAFLSALATTPASLTSASFIYDNLGVVALYSGNYTSNRAFLLRALQGYPDDGQLWLELAVLDEQNSNNAEAKAAVSNASTLGSSAAASVYNLIMSDKPVPLPSRPPFVSQT